jgi:hypothetical protein
MPTQRFTAALFNGAHGCEMARQQLVSKLSAISRPILAEDGG